MDAMRQWASQSPQIGDLEVCCGELGIPAKIATRLPNYSHSTARQSVGNVATAIGQITGIGQEDIARTDLAAVVGDAGRGDAHCGEAVENLSRRAHSRPFPEFASAT